jgi:DNA polymerase-3 subunit epsilon
MYAIVDIETTGGHASANGITEIAICIHDGKKITRRFETLVNPQRDIPVYIRALTGITNEMVQDARCLRTLRTRSTICLKGRSL